MPMMQIDRGRGMQPGPSDEPLDPFAAEAARKAEQARSSEAQREMLRTIAAERMKVVSQLPYVLILKLIEGLRRPVDPTEQALAEAQTENVRADTEGKRAQARRADRDDDDGKQMRNLVAMETLKSGDVEGAQAIAAGRMRPGASPAMAERAREPFLARVEAAKAAAEQRRGTDPVGAVRDFGSDTAALMEEVRRAHPGPAGERLARDVGEVANQYFYATGKAAPNEMPREDGSAGVRQQIIDEILRTKRGQYGPGQEGVTRAQVGASVYNDPGQSGDEWASWLRRPGVLDVFRGKGGQQPTPLAFPLGR